LKLNTIVLLLFLAVFSFACGNRPSHILSEKKMEAVLFDVYLTEGMIDNYPAVSSDTTKKREWLNSIFKKHKIKQADLDTSLAWYMGHLDRYLKINEKLHNRFDKMHAELKRENEPDKDTDALQKLVAGENYIPINENGFFLRPYDLLQHAYTFKVDTNLYRYGGNYKLQFNILGIETSLHPLVTFCAQCADTTFVNRTSVESNGFFESSISIPPMQQVQKLYGSIYFPSIYPSMTIFINYFGIRQDFPDKFAAHE